MASAPHSYTIKFRLLSKLLITFRDIALPLFFFVFLKFHIFAHVQKYYFCVGHKFFVVLFSKHNLLLLNFLLGWAKFVLVNWVTKFLRSDMFIRLLKRNKVDLLLYLILLYFLPFHLIICLPQEKGRQSWRERHFCIY